MGKHFVIGLTRVIDGQEEKVYVKELGETRVEPIHREGKKAKWFLKFNDVSHTADITEAHVFNENKREVIDFGHLERQYTLSTSFYEEVVISPNKPVSEPLATYPFILVTANNNDSTKFTINADKIVLIQPKNGYCEIYFEKITLEVRETQEELHRLINI